MKEQVVLLIDDENNVINSLKRLLRKEPYRIIATTSPEEALSILDRVKVSLVITDQKMEKFDGDEVISQVSEKYPDIKCIKLTGYSNRPGTSQNKGAWKVVPKPWNDDEMKMVIREALEIHRQPKVLNTAVNQEDT